MTTTVTPPHHTRGPVAGPGLSATLAGSRQHLLFAGLLVVMFLAAMVFLPQLRNGNYLMVQAATYAGPLIMALGQTFVVLQVGFDLSIGAMQGFVGGLVYLLIGWGTMDLWVIVLVLLATTAIGTLVHGVLIAKLKMNYFIVTLATYTILPSLLRVILNGSSKAMYSPTLDYLANGTFLGLRVPIWIAAIVFAGLWVLLNRTVFGRNVYAVGSNREAARLAGVNVAAVTMAVYGIAAGCAGLAGLLLVGTMGAADPSAGLGNEFLALTAVLLGGTRFSGGQGTLVGTLLGILFLVVLSNILLLSGMPQFWIGAVQGLVLLISVGIDRARRES